MRPLPFEITYAYIGCAINLARLRYRPPLASHSVNHFNFVTHVVLLVCPDVCIVAKFPIVFKTFIFFSEINLFDID